MTPFDSGDVDRIFLAARDLPAADRARFLDEECRGDDPLRAEVESLLAHDSDEEGLTTHQDAIVVEAMRTLVDPGLGKGKIPDQIGDYRLVRPLGKGGMGVVYEAEQLGDGRRVALKVIRPEFLSPKSLDFFAREGRAGERLEHPGIVRVLETGQTDGFHFIVQELVEGGRTLQDEIDAAQRLPELPDDYYRRVAARFAGIAEALEAAHSAQIIHRDLKPQNILIAEDGSAKVADFGLAKILDEEGLSQTGDFAGTYFYMSPEQVTARRVGIDHRSDIFALGSVLYECLTLAKPFHGDTGQQVAYQISFVDPPNPQALRSRVPEELAILTLRALEKRPQDRIPSMGDLATDLRRFLANQSIRTQAPNVAEKAGKWARKHPVLATAITAISTALVVISSLYGVILDQNRELTTAHGQTKAQRNEARRQRDSAKENEKEAVRERDAADYTTNFLVNLFAESDPSVSFGKPLTAPELLDRGLRSIEMGNLDQRPLLRAKLRTVIGTAQLRMGEYASARATLETAHETRMVHLGEHHRETLVSLNNLAGAFEEEGSYDEAERLQRRCFEARRRSLGEDDPDTLISLSNLAHLHVGQGRYEEAERLQRLCLDARRKTLGETHPDTLSSLHNLAHILHRQSRLKEAEALYLECRELMNVALSTVDPAFLFFLNNLAGLYRSQGRYGDAEPLYVACLEGRRTTLGETHPDTLTTLNDLALLHQAQSDFEKAQDCLERALNGQREARGESHPEVAVAINNLALLQVAQGRSQDALPLYHQALDIYRSSLGETNPRTLMTFGNLASAYKHLGQFDRAEPLYEECLEAQREHLGENHSDTLATLGNLAELYDKQRKDVDAERSYRACLAGMRESLGEAHRSTITTAVRLAAYYMGRMRFEEAEPLLLQARGRFRELLGETHRDTLIVVGHLGGLYHQWGRFDDAEEALVECLDGRRETLGPNDINTIQAMVSLAACYEGAGRFGDGCEVMRECLRVLPSDNPNRDALQDFLARLEEQLKAAQVRPAENSSRDR